MATTDIEVRQQNAFSTLVESIGLPAGAVQLLGLRLTDPDMPYESWMKLGKLIGSSTKFIAWAVGDWMLFGEAVYGEEAANAVSGTREDRYNLAEEITGLAPQTIINYTSLAKRVPLERRRAELPPNMHEPVGKLEPDEQVRWLQEAIDNGWSRQQLKRAIDGKDPDPPEPPGDGTPKASVAERLIEVASHVFHQAQPTGRGVHEVPDELVAQLGAALGEE